MRCRGLHGVAKPAFLSAFPFPALLRVAPYCVPGGVRVVSGVRALPVAGFFVSHMRVCWTEEEQSVGPLARRRDLEARSIPPS
jgi:hypothetical protein